MKQNQASEKAFIEYEWFKIVKIDWNDFEASSSIEKENSHCWFII